MNRRLLRQTATEWRVNLWLALELLVVSVVAWYAVDYLYVAYQTVSRPKGFDAEHCYRITLGSKSPYSPEYIPDRTFAEKRDDYREMIGRLKRVPGVEYVSGSSIAYPYNYSKSSSMQTIRDTITVESVSIRYVTPDFVHVFRYEESGGHTERLVEALERGDAVVSENLYDKFPQVGDIIGDTLTTGRRIGATTRRVLPDDYTVTPGRYVMYNIWDNPNLIPSEICLRVRPEADREFARTLMADAGKHLRVGNLYVSGVESFADIRASYLRENIQLTRAYVAGMVFLLVNIFLGLLGTFWFRTRERECEIAIRKVNGATRSDIFRRLIGEGMLILTVVTVVAVGVDVLVAHYGLNCQGLDGRWLDWSRLAVCALIAYAAVALMIVAGIAIPAWKAMKISPAEALHDE